MMACFAVASIDQIVAYYSGHAVKLNSFSGGFMPSVADGTDFGEVEFDPTTTQASFVFESSGIGVLFISRALLTGSGKVSVFVAPDSMIGPGSRHSPTCSAATRSVILIRRSAGPLAATMTLDHL
jgi:hypothetical protein